MKKTIVLICCVSLLLSSITGCANLPEITGNPKTDGAILGGLAGVLGGQLLGGDSKSTLIGAGIGAGLGYLVAGQKKTEDEINQLRVEGSIVTIWIDNTNGSKTPVRLQKDGYNGYIGPRGERYESMPSENQLKSAYGF